MRCTGHSKPRRLRIELRNRTSAQRWRRQLPGRLASWKMTRFVLVANRTEEIEARRGAGTGGLTAKEATYMTDPLQSACLFGCKPLEMGHNLSVLSGILAIPMNTKYQFAL